MIKERKAYNLFLKEWYATQECEGMEPPCFDEFMEITNMKTKNDRIIRFYDSDTDLIIRTNAPNTLIERAIQHRNHCLENDIEMYSDFEEIRNFIERDEDYYFEEIDYVNDLESYNW